MPDRLQELLRQRALIQEHLAWLEREITAAKSGLPALPDVPEAPALPRPPNLEDAEREFTEAPPPLPNRAATPRAHGRPDDKADAQAEEILSHFQREPRSLEQDARQGCLRAFFIGMGLIFLTAGIIYALYAHHLGRWW